MKQWKWWPNTENAHRLTFYVDELNERTPGLSQKQKEERHHALIRKYYELTYDKDCNISTPEGAAVAIEELGLGTAADAVEWLRRGGGIDQVNEGLRQARQQQISGVPLYMIRASDSQQDVEVLSGAQNSRAFKKAFKDVAK